jgi:hypothetical protein
MARKLLYHYEPKLVRSQIRTVSRLADYVRHLEHELIALLREFDRHRFYVGLGHRSLRSFCVGSLGFSRIQAQRIVTLVRRPPEDKPRVRFLRRDFSLFDYALTHEPNDDDFWGHPTTAQLRAIEAESLESELQDV